MGTTRKLQDELKALLGSNNVYFQPPSNFYMEYPCFVITRGSGSQTPADNSTYQFVKRYTITHIGYDPDDDIIDRMVAHFQMCKYDRSFTEDTLQHDVFSLYW